MGHTIWIEAKGRAGEETHNDMSILHRLDKQLDALADKLGVTKLSEFYDYHVLNDEYGDLAEDEDDDEDQPQGDDGSDVSWFDSVAGLRTVKAVQAELLKDFASLRWKPDRSTKHFPQSLMEDLQFCRMVLEKAVAGGQEFHLLIVP